MNSVVKKISGFTLIEVMVALAIIAIALSALIKASGNHTYSASHLKNKTLAHYVALNEMTKLHIAQAWPGLGTEQKSIEMAGVEWYWTREINKIDNKLLEKNYRNVKFTVYSDEDREKNIAVLHGNLLNPAAPYHP